MSCHMCNTLVHLEKKRKEKKRRMNKILWLLVATKDYVVVGVIMTWQVRSAESLIDGKLYIKRVRKSFTLVFSLLIPKHMKI